MKKLLLFIMLFVSLLLQMSLGFAQTRASVDHTTISPGEPLVLTIETDLNGVSPDVSPLEKHFKILGTSSSSQITIINGSRSSKRTWKISLKPKVVASTSRKITIPGIRVGQEITDSIVINMAVLSEEEKAQEKAMVSQHVFVESSLSDNKKGDNSQTFVQQQIPFSVRFYYDQTVVSGEIEPLKIENAVVEKLGGDTKRNVIKGGKQFTVIEQKYVISPEKSGVFIIPSVVLNGRMVDANKPRSRSQSGFPFNQGFDNGDMFNRMFKDFGNDRFMDDFFNQRRSVSSKPFSVSSQEITVNVLPVPGIFKGAVWLPAESVSIKDSWRKSPPNLMVGEPVSRTLTLQIKGLTGSQIPEISLPKPEGMKTYIEPTKTDTDTDGETVYGFQQFDITYIPNKTGRVTFPEVTIDWWNTKTQKQEKFVLPEWSLNVAKGAAGEEEIVPHNNAIKNLTANDNTDQKDSNSDTFTKESKTTPTNSSSSLVWLGIFFGLALLFLTAYWFVIRKRKKETQFSEKASISADSLKQSLLETCDRNDKTIVAAELLKYIQVEWDNPNIINLGVLANKIANKSDVIIITELEKSLYAASPKQWDGSALHTLIEKGIVPTGNDEGNKASYLKPLYST